MKRTLKRESKVLEIAEIEGMASSIGLGIDSGQDSVAVGLQLALVSLWPGRWSDSSLSYPLGLGQDGFLVV